MAKPKSRITVSNRCDSVVVRATGSYALNLLAVLIGKSPEQTLAYLQAESTDTSTTNDTSIAKKENV